MIPKAHIIAWRRCAPWPEDTQVEQDLILSRALVEMFSQPEVADQALFRGGTALHKLFFDPAGRYSEDIDLVQRDAGPIGTLVDSVRTALDPWLGRPRWRAGHGRFSLHYRFASTSTPVVPMRVKIEVNTREHFSVEGIQYRVFEVENPWFSGSVRIPTYSLSELLATKLRALYQRKKGRDLFDLWLGLDHADVIASDVIAAFMEYMKFGGTPVRRAQFEANMATKLGDFHFRNDITQLLRTGLDYDADHAWQRVHKVLVSTLPGDPWKGGGAR